MALPRPLNWLQKPSSTTAYEEKIRRLELENFELRQRMAAAKEGIEELQSNIEPAIEEVTESFQTQIQAYRNLVLGISETLGTLASSGESIPSAVLQVIAETMVEALE